MQEIITTHCAHCGGSLNDPDANVYYVQEMTQFHGFYHEKCYFELKKKLEEGKI